MCNSVHVGKTRRCVIFWDQERLIALSHGASCAPSFQPYSFLSSAGGPSQSSTTRDPGSAHVASEFARRDARALGTCNVEDMQIALPRDDGNNTVGRMIRPSEINSTDLQELGDPYKVIRPKDALPEARRDASPRCTAGRFRLETPPPCRPLRSRASTRWARKNSA
jgi:hypothetical protein